MRIFSIIFFSLFLIESNIVFSQTLEEIIKTEEEENKIETKFGFGVVIEQLGINEKFNNENFNLNKLQMHLTLASKVRFEFEGAVKSVDDGKTNSAFGFNFLSFNRKNNVSILAGIGIESQTLNWNKTEYEIVNLINGFQELRETEMQNKTSNIKIGLILGAEYFLADRFSVGSEIGLNRVTSNTIADDTTTTSQKYYSTRLNILFRFYLN